MIYNDKQVKLDEGIEKISSTNIMVQQRVRVKMMSSRCFVLNLVINVTHILLPEDHIYLERRRSH